MTMQSKRVILACRVLEVELNFLCSLYEAAPPIVYLEQRLHDTPDKLRVALQQAITDIETEYGDGVEILCGYGLCGTAFTGVSPRCSTLVIPRVHDCIPLLLGSNHDGASASSHNGSTYWLSPGWLTHSQLPYIAEREKRHAEYYALYDEDTAEFLIETENSWRSNYSEMTFVHWLECGAEFAEKARFVADDAGMKLSTRLGNGSLLRQLIEGGKDNSLFVRIRCGQTFDIDGSGTLNAVPYSSNMEL